MRIKHLIILLLILPLAACKQTQVLYSDLSEREANEILALLFASGISGEKTLVAKQSSKQQSYSIATGKESFAAAMMLMQANDLPRAQFQSMGDVFEKTGIVSSALEETARLNHALSEELSATISSIDGVTLARVHLALPKKSMLSGDVQASSAAVFVKHKESISLEKELTKIKALVVDSIENLAYDDVTVVFFEQKPLVYPSFKSHKGDFPSSLQHRASPVAFMQIIPPGGWLLLGALVLGMTAGSFVLTNLRHKPQGLRFARIQKEKQQ